MHKFQFILLIIILLQNTGCQQQNKATSKYGTYTGIVEYGNFSDRIEISIEADSLQPRVFFSSLAQNALNIPFREVHLDGDSISFMLQSDFYRYRFRNSWSTDFSTLSGELTVDSVQVAYQLNKVDNNELDQLRHEDVQFESSGLTLNGTIWYPPTSGSQALVLISSSGNADRSASRAEAVMWAKKGFTVFHYDKRGTGASEGNWNTASMDELVADDEKAIRYFSTYSKIPLTQIGIKGSSQGGTKVPWLLHQIKPLAYGIAVSCPGVTLLESDLNFWKNRNQQLLGEYLEEAAALQKQVFSYIAGTQDSLALKKSLSASTEKPWFKHIWVPPLHEVKTDAKLSYSPIPYFEKTTQPLLIIQGTLDEIIPTDSHQHIREALDNAKNTTYTVKLLKGANHSMRFVGESDFPYWAKLHPDYLDTVSQWVNSLDTDISSE